MFGLVTGLWDLHRCASCASAFLDPRPTPHTIGRAYTTYYTHEAPPAVTYEEPATRLRRARRAVRNGYLNRSFGLDLPSAWSPGAVIAPLVPPLSRRAREWAQLRRPRRAARLLDVGAAPGRSVAHLKALGWQAEGIDVDEQSVSWAQDAGLPVRVGRIEEEDGVEALDAVTFDHSIEHLHDPGSALAAAFRLLRPGGTVWIATPNPRSLGSRMYGRDWVGLDPPRHLTLFSATGLDRLLSSHGFGRVRFHAPRIGGRRYWRSSQALSEGRGVADWDGLPLRACIASHVGESLAAVRFRIGEELLVTAMKPPHA